MKRSDMNHLRRLLGWIRCDIGQSPAELQQTMIDVADGLGHPEVSPEAKTRMVESYRRAESIPLYVRAAVKALEKTLAAGGPARGSEYARTTPESRASIGLHPGADAGHESALNDVQVETGLAEIGIYAWGPRADDWLAGAEYAARHLRGDPHSLAAERGESDASAAAEPLQNLPNAAANGVECRDTPAELHSVRRHIQAAPPASAQDDAKAVAWMDPETLDVISAERKASWLAEYGAGGAAKAACYTRALGDLRPAAGDARRVIQAAVNSIARPKGLTDKQWEYVKAGARLAVSRVNSIAVQTPQGERQ